MYALPLLWKVSLFHMFSPEGLSSPACGHHKGCLEEYLPFSLCRKRYIYLLPLRYDTHVVYLQEQSRFNKVTSKYARCQALCLQRKQSNLKASVITACSGSGSFKGKGGWKGGINSCGSYCQLRASVSNGKIKNEQSYKSSSHPSE